MNNKDPWRSIPKSSSLPLNRAAKFKPKIKANQKESPGIFMWLLQPAKIGDNFGEEALFCQNFKARRRLKRCKQQCLFVRLQWPNGCDDFGDGSRPRRISPRTSSVVILLVIYFCGLNKVSSMENCFVALTACARLGGMYRKSPAFIACGLPPRRNSHSPDKI